MELSAIVFPDTVLSEEIIVPLVPVFSPLVYLQPVENDPALGSDLCTAMAGQSFCRAHAPAPLGPDRERFLHLVSDLRLRRDDYAAQLGHQTLAGISTASSKRSETKSSIVGSLLAGHGIKDADGDRRTQLLWQSRLVLKLAEMHAADQEELRQQMQRIRAKEQGLFAGLREEGENPFGLPGDLTDLRMDTARLRQWYKAWARLLILGENTGLGTRLFISRDRDCVDLVAEEHEKKTSAAPLDLGWLSLPAASRDQGDFVAQVQQFRTEGAALLARVHAWLAGTTGAKVASCLSAEEQSAWRELLARVFPAAAYGRARLTLFACPGQSARHLFAGAFAPEELELLPAAEPEAGRGVILGVLEEEAG